MKNITKKIIAVFAVLCVAVTSLAGCGDKNRKDPSDSSVDMSTPKQYPLSIGEAGVDNPLSIDDPNANLEGEDPQAPADDETGAKPIEEIQDVTNEAGEPVTEVVEVTEANGEKATNAAGAVVTQAVKVTQVVTKPAGSGNAQTATQSAYTPSEDKRYAMWLDISKDENFYFEGDMLKATFKIKENIPDGDYKVRISTVLSDIAGVSVKPSKIIDGVIKVNNGAVENIDLGGETGMVFYGDQIACKQGDTVDFNINIKNNTGLVAFCIWFYFDKNAMELIEAGATGEFEEIARNTEIGSGKESSAAE